MISTRIGTQNFSKAVQEHDFHDEKLHYTAATPDDPKSHGMIGGAEPGQQAVGDILNQIANPSGKPSGLHLRKAHNTLDKDDFLKLMLTQMKNQDPMNPMQSHEMAAQLAQFTSLEQLFNVNKNLESLKHAQDPMQKYEALNFLGKTIKSDTRQILRNSGDKASELRFNLLGDATKVKVTISDETGQTVKVLEYGNLKTGPNKISWAGTNSKDQDVKPGKYIFNVEAFNSAGKKVGVKTETHGTITGVNYTAEGPVLMVGNQSVRLQDVEKIEDENLKANQEAADALRFLKAQKGPGANGASPAQPQVLAPGANGAAMVPENVLQNLSNVGPKPLKTEADFRPKVKPEDKPEAKLTGAILPLEVASSNANGTGSGAGGDGIMTGGAFGHR